MQTITWPDFEKIEIRCGTVVSAEAFVEARKPAYKLLIDFGAHIGMKRSSAQLTALYKPEELVGKQVVAVLNFQPKQIGPFMSECLVLGCVSADGIVTLLQPDRRVQNGEQVA